MINEIESQIIECEKELQDKIADPDLYHKLAILYLQTKNLPQARKYLEQLIIFDPKNIHALNDFGVILDMQGKKEEAKIILFNAIKLDPTYSEPYVNLGKIYTDLKELATAESYCFHALKLNPEHLRAMNNLASIFIKTNRPLKALEFIENALRLSPDDAMALFNYAKLLKYLYKFEQAEQIFNQLLTLYPSDPEIIATFADLKNLQGQPKMAIDLISKALKIDSNNYYVNYYYAIILFNANKYEQAEYYCKKALSIEPSLELLGILANIQLNFALYEEFEHTKNQALKLVQSSLYYDPINPFLSQLLFEDNAIQHNISQKWAKQFVHKTKIEPFPRKQYNHSKLRIGYISGDFGNHPIGLLVENLFNLHDRNSFEIYGFSTRKHFCSRYQKICSQFDKFESLDMKDPIQAAQIIHELEIDILIDLVGPTANDNYDILALQPASIQCHMLGYTGTMGADYIQYFITTKTVTPKTMSANFSEKIVYMPHTEIAHAGFTIDNEHITRAEYNLPNDKFIFIAHHSSYRINQKALYCWMQILKAVPNSILWFYCNHPIAKKNILHFAAQYGIAETQIIFYEDLILTNNWPHRLADLFLDTFTHTTGTVSFLCAWAGLPMLTMLGNTPQSRVCSSICYASNAPEQVVISREEYIERAIYLANNPDKLTTIKEKLLANRHRSKLFNQKQYVKYLESAFNLMWEDFCNGDISKEIVVPINKEYANDKQ